MKWWNVTGPLRLISIAMNRAVGVAQTPSIPAGKQLEVAGRFKRTICRIEEGGNESGAAARRGQLDHAARSLDDRAVDELAPEGHRALASGLGLLESVHNAL